MSARIQPFTPEELARVRTPAVEQRLDDAETALALALLLSSALAQADDLALGPRVEGRAHMALVTVFDHGWKSLRAVQHVLYRQNHPVLVENAPDLECVALQSEDSTPDTDPQESA